VLADTVLADTLPTELVLVGPVPAGLTGSSLDGTDIFLQG
jgi:hypothetical protein